MAFSEAVDINPRRTLPKVGDVAFLDMASLPLNGAPVLVQEKRPVSSGGARFQVGDTLFARITPCAENGKLGFVQAIAGGPTAQGSTEFIVLAARDSVTAPEYVRCLAGWGHVRENAIGLMEGTSGRQRIPVWAFDEIEVPIPPLDEQRRIADILRSADGAIAAERAHLDQQVRVIDAFFDQWSNQPCAHVALGELLDFKNGINFEKDERSESGTLTLDVMNMFSANMTPTYEGAYRISKAVPTDLILRKGDVLFVRSSVRREGVGWTSLADGFPESMTFCGFIIRGRPRSSNMLPGYVVGVLRSPRYRQWMIQHSTRSALTNINQKTIASIEIPLPDLNQQRALLGQYEVMADVAAKSRCALQRLEQLRVEIATDLLSGRVRVPA
jgi:hypothetical protein